MPFRDADDVHRYLGGVFESAFADDDLGPRLRGTGVVLRLRLSDPDATLVVDAPGGVVVGDGEAAPTATMSMSAETGNAYWQGKVNLPMAMATGKISVDGNIAGLLKIAPLAKKLYPVYTARLTADGRDDLLV